VFLWGADLYPVTAEVKSSFSTVLTTLLKSYGDGVEVNNCPNTVVMAMLLLIGPFYENREDASLGQGLNVVTLPWIVKASLDTERFDCFSYSAN
jgi:hypothetical protein